MDFMLAKDLLKDFVNAVMEDSEFPQINKLSIKNPFNLKELSYFLP